MPRIKLDLASLNKKDSQDISSIVLRSLRNKNFKPTGFHFRIDVQFYENEASDSANYGETVDDDSYWDKGYPTNGEWRFVWANTIEVADEEIE